MINLSEAPHRALVGGPPIDLYEEGLELASAHSPSPIPLVPSARHLGRTCSPSRDYRPLVPPLARRKVISLPLITISEVATFV